MPKNAKLPKGVTCKKGYYYARIEGKQTYFGKGQEGRKLAEAAKAKETVKRYENRQVSAGLKVKRQTVKTFKDLLNYYMTLPTIQNMKIYQRRVYIAAHLMDFFGNKQVASIEVDDQERYRQKRENEGAASSTIDLEINLFSAIFNLAIKRKVIPAEYRPGEIIRKNERDPRPIISEADFNAILAQCGGDLADFLRCGYESAMRINEIAELTPSQVHLDIPHISGTKLDYIDLGIFDTKTGTRRTVPVSQMLKEILERRMKGLADDERIFTNSLGGKWTSPHVAKVVQVACDKAGVPYGDKARDHKGNKIGFVFHCLRHTRTTLWVSQGFSDEIVRRATGHATLAAYQNYVKLEPLSMMRLVSGQETKTGEKREKNAVNTYQMGV